MADPYKDKTNEQLEGMIKAQKIICYAIIGVSIPLIALSLWSIFYQEKNSTGLPTLVVGFACFAMVPIQMLSMKKIKEELARRAESGN